MRSQLIHSTFRTTLQRVLQTSNELLNDMERIASQHFAIKRLELRTKMLVVLSLFRIIEWNRTNQWNPNCSESKSAQLKNELQGWFYLFMHKYYRILFHFSIYISGFLGHLKEMTNLMEFVKQHFLFSFLPNTWWRKNLSRLCKEIDEIIQFIDFNQFPEFSHFNLNQEIMNIDNGE